MKLALKLALGAGVAAAATVAAAQPAQQRVTGPVAVYWMSARTQSGFGMPAGGRPDPQAMMRAMMGGAAAQKSLTLQLGSSQTAPAPTADHLPPTGLQAGPALPLVTPRVQPAGPPSDEQPQMPRDFQRPRGKMLIFWGCGERARPGQPVVIDFAQMTQNPAAMAGLVQGIQVTPQRPPAPGRNTTYGEWPNEKATTAVPPGGSLVGDHAVRGNYSPEIKFSLAAAQDFLGPLTLTTNEKARAGHANLGWALVPNAQAYLATAMGGGQETVVLWSSSEVQAMAMAMPEFISPGDLTRLVASKVLMGPTQSTCAVPREVVAAAPEALVQMTAYGPEANFIYPPRPPDPTVTWAQQWAVKVRYRSATGGLLGMEMPQMPAGAGAFPVPGTPPPGQPPGQPPPRGRPGFPGLPGGLPIPIPGRPRLPF